MRLLLAALLALLASCAEPEQAADRGIGGTGAPTATADRGIGGTGAPTTTADRGIGGTGIGVDLLGAITRLDQLTVNGVTIDLPPGTVDDGTGPLRVGQVVAIAARAEAGHLVAERVEPRPIVVGPVEPGAPAGLLRVAGQDVQPPEGPAPPVGAWVAVAGFARGDGVVIANRIDPAEGPVVRVTALLRDGADGPMLGAARLRPGTATVAPGQVVTVEGRFIGGLLIAASARPAAATPFDRSDRRVLLQAFVADAGDQLLLGPGQRLRRAPDLAAPAIPLLAIVQIEPDSQGNPVAAGIEAAALPGAGSPASAPAAHALPAATPAATVTVAPAATQSAGPSTGARAASAGPTRASNDSKSGEDGKSAAGAASNGASSGGSSSGGSSSGGSSTGASSGGASSSGTASGGATAGGTATGSGGATATGSGTSGGPGTSNGSGDGKGDGKGGGHGGTSSGRDN